MKKQRFKFKQNHHRRLRRCAQLGKKGIAAEAQLIGKTHRSADIGDDWDMAHDLEGENAIPVGYEEFRFYAHQLV